MINRFLSLQAVILGMLIAGNTPLLGGGVRIKDMALVAGARDNQLVGYGLVVGLAGDGDKDQKYTVQTIANMLQRFGVNLTGQNLSAKNIAAVMVTADIPAFIKPGARLDVTVSSIGDAQSITGGILVQTPLVGADGKIYAVAQGAVSVGGFSAGVGGGGGATVQKNHPTAGQIIGGALVEREIPAAIVHENIVELLLREPDFTSSARMAAAINERFAQSAMAVDSTTVRVRVPEGFQAAPINFIAHLEAVELEPDMSARIVVNERTGTIVATARVQISNCAVSHGNITISIASTLDVSQPQAFSQTGRTVVAPRTDTTVVESKSKLVTLPDLPTIEKVASALNAIGVSPRDMMAIFQAMKQAGALRAELVIR